MYLQYIYLHIHVLHSGKINQILFVIMLSAYIYVRLDMKVNINIDCYCQLDCSRCNDHL